MIYKAREIKSLIGAEKTFSQQAAELQREGLGDGDGDDDEDDTSKDLPEPEVDMAESIQLESRVGPPVKKVGSNGQPRVTMQMSGGNNRRSGLIGAGDLGIDLSRISVEATNIQRQSQARKTRRAS